MTPPSARRGWKLLSCGVWHWWDILIVGGNLWTPRMPAGFSNTVSKIFDLSSPVYQVGCSHTCLQPSYIPAAVHLGRLQAPYISPKRPDWFAFLFHFFEIAFCIWFAFFPFSLGEMQKKCKLQKAKRMQKNAKKNAGLQNNAEPQKYVWTFCSVCAFHLPLLLQLCILSAWSSTQREYQMPPPPKGLSWEEFVRLAQASRIPAMYRGPCCSRFDHLTCFSQRCRHARADVGLHRVSRVALGLTHCALFCFFSKAPWTIIAFCGQPLFAFFSHLKLHFCDFWKIVP